MKNSHRVKLTGLSLVLGCAILLPGCDSKPANYVAPGEGTYDRSNDIAAPENVDKLVTFAIGMLSNPYPVKAKRAMDSLGRLGAKAEAALPELEKQAKNYPDDDVKKAAQETIDLIKADMAKPTE
jgi:hypothetical protein